MLMEDIRLTQTRSKWLVPLVKVFGVVGAVIGGVAADLLGRRLTLLVSAGLHGSGVLIMALAPSYAAVLIGRSLMGLGIGSGLTVGAVFLVELAPPSARGFLLAFPQIFMNIGSAFGYMAFSEFSGKLPDHYVWRVMVVIGLLPSLAVIIVGRIIIPETPSWLMRYGHIVDASNVAFRCARDRVEADLRLERLTAAVEGLWVDELQTGIPRHLAFRGLLRPGRNGLAPLTKVILLHVIQQFSSERLILLLGRMVLGLSDNKIICHQIQSTWEVIVIEIAWMLAFSLFFDRIGRRILCLASIGGIAAFQLILGGLTLVYSIHRDAGWLIDPLFFASIIGMVSSFAFGLGPIPWIHNPEWLCFRLRARGSSIAVVANLIASFLTGILFKLLLNSVPFGGLFVVYSAYMVVGFLY